MSHARLCYRELIEKVFSMKRYHRDKANLQFMRTACQELGLYPETLPSIHVTGTNGKGSVCWKVYQALHRAGYHTGVFTSPHINSFRERIQVDGECIAVPDVEEGLNFIFEHTKSMDLCFFEIATLLAYRYFQARKVDVAVIEVGMGGRLDATNLVIPHCSVITSLGMDHLDILGPTIDDIAREKAGIIKEGRPLFLGPTADHPVVLSTASAFQSEVHVYAPHSAEENCEETNSGLSKMILESLRLRAFPRLDSDCISFGVVSRPICRFEEVERDGMKFILDCAHNEPAFRALFSRFSPARSPMSYIVLCFSEDKDIVKCLQIIRDHYSADQILLFEPISHRSITPEALVGLVRQAIPDYSPPMAPCSPSELIQRARQSFAKGSTFLICGSMYILGPCREALGLPFVTP